MAYRILSNSFPADGRQPDPEEFRAGFFGYFAYCLLPVGMVCFFWTAVSDPTMHSSWDTRGLGASVVLLVCAIVWVMSMRLAIDREGVRYRNFLRGARSIRYTEISSAVVWNFRSTELDDVAGTGRGLRLWALILTPSVETGKPPLKIPLTFFGTAAHDRMIELLKPQDWYPQSD